MREREFSTKEVSAILGIPYPTLDRWIAAGAVVPDVPADGIGTRRRFLLGDVILAELARVLKEHHLTLPAIAAIAEAVRTHWRPGDPFGAMLVSPDGGLVLGGLPSDPFQLWPDAAKERDAWPLRDPDKAGGFGAILFRVDMTQLARQVEKQVAEFGGKKT